MLFVHPLSSIFSSIDLFPTATLAAAYGDIYQHMFSFGPLRTRLQSYPPPKDRTTRTRVTGLTLLTQPNWFLVSFPLALGLLNPCRPSWLFGSTTENNPPPLPLFLIYVYIKLWPNGSKNPHHRSQSPHIAFSFQNTNAFSGFVRAGHDGIAICGPCCRAAMFCWSAAECSRCSGALNLSDGKKWTVSPPVRWRFRA